MQVYKHYINGQYCDPVEGQWFNSENPYTGTVWAQVARGSKADVDAAVKAAKAAFDGEWGQ
jgi:acyl-CoA reductase-like NAD-dependent aldehyde dehydrogenase